MALTTDTGKLAIMEWDLVFEPGLPLSPGTFDQADQQQLLWSIPEVLWAAVTGNGGVVFASAAVRPSVLADAGGQPSVLATVTLAPSVIAVVQILARE